MKRTTLGIFAILMLVPFSVASVYAAQGVRLQQPSLNLPVRFSQTPDEALDSNQVNGPLVKIMSVGGHIYLQTASLDTYAVNLDEACIRSQQTVVSRDRHPEAFERALRECVVLTLIALNTLPHDADFDQAQLQRFQALYVLDNLFQLSEQGMKTSTFGLSRRHPDRRAFFVHTQENSMYAQVIFSDRLRVKELRYYYPEEGALAQRIVFDAQVGVRLLSTKFKASGDHVTTVEFDPSTNQLKAINGLDLYHS